MGSNSTHMKLFNCSEAMQHSRHKKYFFFKGEIEDTISKKNKNFKADFSVFLTKIQPLEMVITWILSHSMGPEFAQQATSF